MSTKTKKTTTTTTKQKGIVEKEKKPIMIERRHSTDLVLPNRDKQFCNDDFITKIGGKAQFDFFLISFCEEIKDDERLQPFFGCYGMDSMVNLFRDFCLALVLEPNGTSTSSSRNTQQRIVRRFRCFFKIGLNESHFDMIEKYFLSTLEDCWVQEDVVGLCKINFAELRPIFKQNARLEQQQEQQEGGITTKEEFLVVRLTEEDLTLKTREKDGCCMCQSMRTYASLSKEEKDSLNCFQEKKGKKGILPGRTKSGESLRQMFGINKDKRQRSRTT